MTVSFLSAEFLSALEKLTTIIGDHTVKKNAPRKLNFSCHSR